MQAAAFPSEPARVAYIIIHLAGRGEAWLTAEWARNSPIFYSCYLLTNAMYTIFDTITTGPELVRAINNLHQGSHQVSDYASSAPWQLKVTGTHLPGPLLSVMEFLTP